MLKILYISYDGMTDPLGQSQVLPYLVGLAEKNHEIHLISCEKPENQGHKPTIQQIIDKAKNLFWHPISYTKSPPVLSTVKDIRSLLSLSKKLHQTHAFNIVHCRSYIAAIIGMSLQKQTGTKFLFDMRGFWVDERIEGKIWNVKNPIFGFIASYFKQLERKFFKRSDAVVSLTHKGKEILIQKYGVDEDKIEVIPCCADLNLFSKSRMDMEKLAKIKSTLIGSQDHFILSYVGSIGTWYMVEEMFQFFKLLQSQTPAKFLFITKHTKGEVLDLAKKFDIHPNDVIIKAGEREEMPYLIALSQASIFFIKPSFSKQASSPTKMAEIMGLKIPIVCNSNVGDVKSIMDENKAGVVVDDLDQKSLQEATSKLLNGQFDYTPNMEAFSTAYGIDKYNSIYHRLSKTQT